MATWIWVVIAIAVVAVIALGTVWARKRRTAALRGRFGPEYDRAVENRGGQRAAEADLRAREKQWAQLDITPLPEATRVRFAGEWRDVQEHFVDQPEQAATAADTLVTEVMESRGYPMKDFDAQADLVSVDHPDTVENYRFAHAVRQRAQKATARQVQPATCSQSSAADDSASPPNRSHRIRGGSAIEQTDGPVAVESDDPDPAASDQDYNDQQIGSRGGR